MLKRKIYNTGTKQFEENPINKQLQPQYDPDAFETAGDDMEDYQSRMQPFKGFDPEYMGASTGNAALDQQFAANQQSGGAKLGRSIARGVGKGLVGTTKLPAAGLGTALSAIGFEDAGQFLNTFVEDSENYIDQELAVHEQSKTGKEGVWDSFFSYGTAESIFASATEFGLGGMGIGFATRKLGMAALNLGATIESIAGASRVGSKVAKGMIETGRYASQGVRLPLGIKSDALVSGLLTNQVEGYTMAKEVEKEMTTLYSSYLYDPFTPEEVKQSIRNNIADAGNTVQGLNSFMAISNVIGFNTLTRGLGQTVDRPGLWSYIKNNVAPIAPIEGAEEMLQGVLQADAQFQQKLDIEEENKDYSDDSGIKFPDGGIPMGQDLPMLYQVDPGDAQETAFNKIKLSSERLLGHAFSTQSMVEGLSGLLGGGPRWMITGIPTMRGTIKSNKEQYEFQQAYKGDVTKVLNALASDDLMNEVDLNEVVEQINSISSTDPINQEVQNAVTDYALANTVLRGIKNNQVDFLHDFLREQRDVLQTKATNGEDVQLEMDRLDKTSNLISKYQNLTTYPNGAELIQNALKEEAADAALRSAQAVAKNTPQPKSELSAPPPTVKAEASVPDDGNTDTTDQTTPLFTVRDWGTSVDYDLEENPQEIKDLASSIAKLFKNNPNTGKPAKNAVSKAATLIKMMAKSRGDIMYKGESDNWQQAMQDNIKGETIEEVRQSVGEMFGVDLGYSAQAPAEQKPIIPNKSTPIEAPVVSPTPTRAELDQQQAVAQEEGDTALFLQLEVEEDFVKAFADIKSGKGTVHDYIDLLQKYKTHLQKNSNVLTSTEGRAKAIKDANEQQKLVKLGNKFVKSKNVGYLTTQIESLKLKIGQVTDTNTQLKYINLLSIATKRRSELLNIKQEDKTPVTQSAAQNVVETEVQEATPEEVAEVDAIIEQMEDGGDVPAEVIEDTTDPVAQEVIEARSIEDDLSFLDDNEEETKGELKRQRDVALGQQVAQQVLEEEGGEEIATNAAAALGSFSESVQEEQSKRQLDPGIFKDPTEPIVQGNDKEIQYLVKTVADITEIARKANPDFIPSVDFVGGFFEQIGVDLSQADRTAVEGLISIYTGQTISQPNSPVKFVQPKAGDQAETIQYDDVKEEPVLTAESLDISGTAIGWESGSQAVPGAKAVAPIRDYDSNKEGDAILFDVLRDADIAEIDKRASRSNGAKKPVYITVTEYNDDGTSYPETIDWPTFLANQLPTGDGTKKGYKGDPNQTIASMRPILVKSSQGAVLGRVHTTQWVDRRKGTTARPVTEAQREAVKQSILNLRARILRHTITNKTSSMPGTITSRKGNIQATERYFKGTALAVGQAWNTTANKIPSDAPVKFGVIGNEGTIIGNLDANIIIPEFVQQQPGANVMIVPLEDSGLFTAVKLINKQTSRDQLELLLEILTRKMLSPEGNNESAKLNSLALSKFVTSDPNAMWRPTPRNMKRALNDLVNTDFVPSANHNYKALRISARVEGEKDQILVLDYTTGGNTFTVRYEYGLRKFATQGQQQSVGTYTLYEESLEKPAVTGRDFSTEQPIPISYDGLMNMLGASIGDPASYPYLNVSYGSLAYQELSAKTMNSSADGDTELVVSTIKKDPKTGKSSLGRERKNYFEYVKENTMTNLQEPLRTKEGNYSFVTNTIVNVMTADSMPKDVKDTSKKVVQDNINQAEKEAKKQQSKKVVIAKKNLVDSHDSLTALQSQVKSNPDFVLSAGFAAAIVGLGNTVGYSPTGSSVELKAKLLEGRVAKDGIEYLKRIKASANRQLKTLDKDVHSDTLDQIDLGQSKKESIFGNFEEDTDPIEEAVADLTAITGLPGFNTTQKTREAWNADAFNENITLMETLLKAGIVTSNDALELQQVLADLENLLTSSINTNSKAGKEATNQASVALKGIASKYITDEVIENTPIATVDKAIDEDITLDQTELDELAELEAMIESTKDPISTPQTPPISTDPDVELSSQQEADLKTTEELSAVAQAQMAREAELKKKSKTPLVVSIAKRMLSQYTKKYKDEKGLNGTEKVRLIKDMRAIVAQTFLGYNEENLTSDQYAAIKGDSVGIFTRNMMDAIETLDKYKKHLEGEKELDQRNWDKADELITIYTDLLKGNETFDTIANVGFETALSRMGFKVSTSRVTRDAETGFEEAEKYNINIEGSTREPWQSLQYSILKNPMEGVTARIRAKLMNVFKYRVNEQDEVANDVGMLGTPTFEDNVFTKVAELFVNNPTHNLSDKLLVLDAKVKEIQDRPADNVMNYFIVGLYRQLLGNSDAAFTYDSRELQQFNTVFTKDRLNMVGVAVKGENGRITRVNYTFNTILQTLFRGTTKAISDIVSNAGDEFNAVLDLLKPSKGQTVIKSKSDYNAASKIVNMAIDLVVNGNIEAFSPANLERMPLSSLLEASVAISTKTRQIKENIVNLKDPAQAGAAQYGLTIMVENLSDEIGSRASDILSSLGVNIAPQMGGMLSRAMQQQDYIPVEGYTGVTGKSVKLDRALLNMVKELDAQGFNATAEPKQAYLGTGARTILRWIGETSKDAATSAVTRVGTKMAANYTDPIKLNEFFKKFRTEDFIAEAKNDVIGSGSLILKVVEEYGDSALPMLAWIKNVYKDVDKGGLLPTWASDVDNEDGAFEHAIYNVGNYLSSIGFGYKRKESLLPGNAYSKIEIYGKEMEVREGKFSVGTFSDKNNPHVVSGLDFNVTTMNENTAVINTDAIEVYADAVVVPELNKILATQNHLRSTTNDSRTAINIQGYQGLLVYGLADLNNGYVLQNILERLEKAGLTRIESLSTLEVADDYKEDLDTLKEMIYSSVQNHHANATTNYVNSLERSGIINRGVDGFYTLNWQAREAQEFRNFLYTKEEKEQAFGAANDEYAPVTLSGQAKEEYETSLVGLYTGISEHLAKSGAASFAELTDPAKASDFMGPNIELLDIIESIMITAFPKDAPIRMEVESQLADFDRDPNVMVKEINDILSANGIQLFTNGMFTQKELTPPKKLTAFKQMFEEGSLEQLTGRMKTTVGYESNDDSPQNKAIINEARLVQTMSNYTYSYGINLANMYQLFYGDMSMYYSQDYANKSKTFGSPDYDYVADVKSTQVKNGKRMAQFVSPAVFSEGSKKYINLYVTDPKEKSPHYGAGNTNGISDVGEIDSMDAGSFVSMDARIDQLIAEGEMYERERSIVKRMWEGKITSEEAQKKIKRNVNKLNPGTAKPRSVSHRNYTLANGMNLRVPEYGKLGETVITNALSGTSKTSFSGKMNGIINQLEEELNIGVTNEADKTRVRIVPLTGIKTGATAQTLNITNVMFDDITGKFVVKKATGNVPIDSSVYSEMSYENYGRQQRTDAKEFKQVYASGQVENLAFNNVPFDMQMELVGKPGKQVNLRRYWENIKAKKHELSLASIDMLFKAYRTTGDLNKILTEEINLYKDNAVAKVQYTDMQLSELIKASLATQSDVNLKVTNPLVFKWLEVDPVTSKFKYDITNSTYFERFLDVIRKNIEGKSVRAKRNGYNTPLAPDLGVDLSPEGLESSGITLLDGVELDQFHRLKPQIPGKEGEKSTAAQVLVKFDYKAIDDKGKTIKLKMSDYIYTNDEGKKVINPDLIPKEVLSQIGYRTPTQDYNMMSYIEVVGFLPESYPTTIIAPKEFVATMGSDFDIDKLFGYKYNLYTDHLGRLEIIDRKHVRSRPSLMNKYLDNEITRVLQTVLSNDDIIKNDISKPLNGEDVFRGFANELYDITNEGQVVYENESYLTPAYSESKRNKASGASMAIAVFAKFTRVYAQFKGREIPLLTRVKGNLVPTEVALGDFKPTEFAGKRSSIFVKTKPSLTDKMQDLEASMDATKNNGSAMLSISVDDETLGILGMLGLDSYTEIKAMMMLGLRAKTAIAIMNLPMFKSEVGRKAMTKQLEALYSSRVSTDGGINPGNVKKDKLLNPANFTMLKRARDANGNVEESSKIDEVNLIQNLLDWNRKLRQGLNNVGGSDALSNKDILDALRIMKFVTKATGAYTTTVQSVSNLVNLDSKGIPREAAELNKYRHLIEGEKNEQLWAYIDKIPEIRRNKEVLEKYLDKYGMFFRNNVHISGVLNIVNNAGIPMASLQPVLEAYRAKRFQALKPDMKSLTERLSTLRYSTDPAVKEFVSDNSFLTGLVFSSSGGTLAFNNEGTIEPVDIMNDLEALIDAGEVGGIDMNILHSDLINFALSSTGLSQGNTYEPFVDPKYYNFNTADSNSIGISHYKLAAYVAFKAINKLGTTSSKTPGSYWRVRDLTTKKLYVAYTNEQGVVNKYTDVDFKAHTKQSKDEYIEAMTNTPISASDAADIAEGTNNNEALLEGELKENLQDRVKFNTLSERLFTQSTQQNLKKVIRILFPTNAKFEVSNKSQWSTVSGLSINKARIAGRDASNTIVHEITHSALMEALKQYLQGNLPTIENSDSNIIAEEARRVFENLETAKDDITKTVAGIIGDSHYKKDSHFSKPYLLRGIIDVAFVDFLSVVDNKEIKLAQITEQLGLEPGTFASRMDLIHYVLKNKMYALTSNPRNVSKVLTIVDKNNQPIHTLTEMDESYKNLLDTISNTQYVNEEMESDFRSTTLAKRTSADKSALYFDFAYGLTDLHEFLSQSFKMGTRSTKGTSSVPGYNSILSRMGGKKAYNPISERESIPSEMQSMYTKVLDLIRKLLNAILGTRDGNKLYKDVMYAKLLVNNSKFVRQVNRDAEVMWAPLDETAEILKC